MEILHAFIHFCNLFRPTKSWLVVLVFLVSSAMCLTYAAPRVNAAFDPMWSLIGKTILQTGAIYLNIVSLTHRGLIAGTHVVGFLLLLMSSVCMLATAWVVWALRLSQWMDVVMSGVDILLFTASAQWLLAIEDRRTFDTTVPSLAEFGMAGLGLFELDAVSIGERTD